jgi:hypothetical protein
MTPMQQLAKDIASVFKVAAMIYAACVINHFVIKFW